MAGRNKEDQKGSSNGRKAPTRRESAMMGLAISCKSIANEVEKEFAAKEVNIQFTDRAIARVGQLVSETVMQHYVKDLFAFANHARRQLPNINDVKLLYRRNPEVEQRIDPLLKSLNSAINTQNYPDLIPADRNPKIRSLLSEKTENEQGRIRNETAETAFYEEGRRDLITKCGAKRLGEGGNEKGKEEQDPKLTDSVYAKKMINEENFKRTRRSSTSKKHEDNSNKRKSSPTLLQKSPNINENSKNSEVSSITNNGSKNHKLLPKINGSSKVAKLIRPDDSFYDEAENLEWAKQILGNRKQEIEKEKIEEEEPKVTNQQLKLDAHREKPMKTKVVKNDSFYNPDDDVAWAEVFAPVSKKIKMVDENASPQSSTSNQKNPPPAQIQPNLPTIETKQESPTPTTSSAPPIPNHPPTPILPGDWFQPESHSTPLNAPFYQRAPNETLNLSIDTTPHRRFSQTTTPKLYNLRTTAPRLGGLFKGQKK